MSIALTPIGIVHSPFADKFGIPRQPGLVPSIRASIELLGECAHPACVRGLEHCSHLWVIFLFSATAEQGWHPTVRPPRLGGNQRLGVFATRSTFRPNPLGLSVVKLEGIRQVQGRLFIDISAADLMDQTPVLDIKPYLPYADAVADASFMLANAPEPLSVPVIFTPGADTHCRHWEECLQQPLRRQIEELLRCDPRPAYQRSKSDRLYGVRLYQLDIRFRIHDHLIEVVSIEEFTTRQG